MDSKVLGADMRLLELLSQTFPNSSSASTEIINLEAIMNLPKGTEHFVADIHGEHEAFLHILRNASGNMYFNLLSREETGNDKRKSRRRPEPVLCCFALPTYTGMSIGQQ